MLPTFVIPFVAYLVGMSLLVMLPKSNFPWAYSILVLAVGALTVFLWRGKSILRPHANIAMGMVVGLLGIAAWIGLCKLDLEAVIVPFLPDWAAPKPRVGFNPFDEISSPIGCWSFIAVRLIGLSILVPLIEEIFWRGFLARWLVDENWENVALGRFTLFSFCAVVVLFMLAHPEWLAAAVYCALLNGLLIWKKDLWQCVVAHMVSNLALGIYVLCTGSWWLW